MKNTYKLILLITTFSIIGVVFFYLKNPIIKGIFAYKNADYETAYFVFKELADQGDIEAQGLLGNMLYTGKGVTTNYYQALSYLKLSALKGDSNSQCRVAVAYESGTGVEKDDAEAMSWYEKSAKQGHPYSQVSVGFLKSERFNDKNEAFYWYKKASENNKLDDLGSLAGYESIASMYEYGYGTKIDLKKALYWYKKAAEFDPAYAESVADMYRSGKGTEVDIEKALYWYQISAERYKYNTSSLLSLIGYNGTKGNYKEAYKWCYIENKEKNPSCDMKDFDEKITKEQMNLIKEEADNWLLKYGVKQDVKYDIEPCFIGFN
jgi:hypothetical protein